MPKLKNVDFTSKMVIMLMLMSDCQDVDFTSKAKYGS